METMTHEQALAVLERCVRKLRKHKERWDAGELSRARRLLVELITAAVTPGVRPHAVVVLDGGLVQDVVSNVPMSYTVVDYDCEGADDSELVDIPQDGGGTEEAVGHTYPATVDPVWLAGAVAAIDAQDAPESQT